MGPEFGHRGLERLLSAAEDEDEGTLIDKALCRSEADAGRAAGNHGGLSVQSGHVVHPLLALHKCPALFTL